MTAIRLRFWHPLGLLCLAFAGSLNAAEQVSTIAGDGRAERAGDGGPGVQAGVGGPFGVTIGPDGALYICETIGHCVRRLDLKDGTITTVAGSGRKGYAGDGQPAAQALCHEPYEVRFDPAGHMYFVEMQNHLVRRVDAKTQAISTVAGTGQPGFSGDGGLAVKAQLNVPHSIVLDDAGQLYIADIGNHRLRVVDLGTGRIRTLSGTGARAATPDGAPLAGTPLNGPRALDYSPQRGLYLALREGNAVFRIDLQAGRLAHLAGTGKSGYAGDGGPAREALLSGPKGIALSPRGDLYLADTERHTIRVIRTATGIIETVVGDGKQGDGPDGPPRQCRLNRPHGVYLDAAGILYIGDSSNNKVRRIKVEE